MISIPKHLYIIYASVVWRANDSIPQHIKVFYIKQNQKSSVQS